MNSQQYLALGVAYEGSAYHGWQVQPQVETVQGCLTRALSEIAQEPIHLSCAGRTDAGVHALTQVVHFQTQAMRPLSAWVRGTNSHLPPDIQVRWAHLVSNDFHARFSAQWRRYQYLIATTPLRPLRGCQYMDWLPRPLDVMVMRQAAAALLGEHDFSAFRGAGCQSKTPCRYINHLDIYVRQGLVVVDVQANAFLLHMVRNIVGSLCVVGLGERPAGWLEEVLLSRDRRQAAKTAPPQGLTLCGVRYPARYGLPLSYVPAWKII